MWTAEFAVRWVSNEHTGAWLSVEEAGLLGQIEEAIMWNLNENEHETVAKGEAVTIETKRFFELLISAIDKKPRLSKWDRQLKSQIVAFLDVHGESSGGPDCDDFRKCRAWHCDGCRKHLDVDKPCDACEGRNKPDA